MNFITHNDILSDIQFGFRKDRFTELAIQTLVENCYDSIENNNIMIGLFIDFSKAFETICHNILLRKLNIYGIRGTANEWFHNYLANQKQYVMYNNSSSELWDINFGVPQGSILGPLLFLM